MEIDNEIERLIKVMNDEKDPGSIGYEKMAEALEHLMKARDAYQKSKVSETTAKTEGKEMTLKEWFVSCSPDTVLGCATTLVMASMMLGYEKENIIKSKVCGFIPKIRLF